jgi:uncharacterized tellurite resistance protein B-like protein
MHTPTEANVRPLVGAEEVRGDYLHVSFRCPLTHHEATSWARIGGGDATVDEAAETLLGRARQALARLVGRVSGEQPRPGAGGSPPEGDRGQALVSAFKRVQSQFAWDEHNERWAWASLVAGAQGDLTQMLERVRFTEPVDRRCLARILAEVALADGSVAAVEKQFFESFTGEAAGEIARAAGAGELTDEELTDTTPFLREPMLALAWALAYTDRDLASAEEARLAKFARGLEISERRAAVLQGFAREYVVEEMVSAAYADGAVDPAMRPELSRAAAQIGVTPQTMEQIERRVRRLRGMDE